MKTNRLFIITILLLIITLPIQHIWAYSEVIPNDPDFNEQWYLEQIDAPEAWTITTGSSEVVVAVIDTGVDLNHPDIKKNIWTNFGEIAGDGRDNDNNGFVDDVYGWNWVDNNNQPTPKVSGNFKLDAVNHGTLVAGLIAAQGDNNKGIVGIAWQAKIMSLRILDDLGNGDAHNAIKAIDYAVNNGADIINMSFTGFSADPDFQEAIDRAYSAGLIIVAAVGNDSSEGHGVNLDNQPAYPSCFGCSGVNKVLGVASLDTLDQKADFSNYGQQCVDISAPGVVMYSTTFQKPTMAVDWLNTADQYFVDYYEGGYAGTSFSAPLVSGTAALVKAFRPNLSNQQIYRYILSNTDIIDGVNRHYQGLLGQGKLNVFKVLQAVQEKTIIHDSNNYFAQRSTLVITKINQPDGQVYLFNSQGQLIHQFIAWPGARNNFSLVALDVDNDNLDDIVVGAPAGQTPYVRIFDQLGNLKGQWLAFTEDQLVGVQVAAGDLDNNGTIEIVVSRLDNQQVQVFDKQGNQLLEFIAYENDLTRGVGLAIADVDADGYQEIITAPANCGNIIKIFNFKGQLKARITTPGYYQGINLAVGDVNNNGVAEIITAPLNGADSLVQIFDWTGNRQSQFSAFGFTVNIGVNITSGDVNQDGFSEVVSIFNSGDGPHLRLFDYQGNLLDESFLFPDNITGGLNVVAIN